MHTAPQTPLPTETDFDPHGGDLDAQCAWKCFGGLSLDQAAERFRQSPENHQEHFMWMGGKAFAFYFPVVDTYLREVPDADDDHDDATWILAHCIKQQFEATTAQYVLPLKDRVMALSKFVQQNIRRYGHDADEQRRIADAWIELDSLLANVK